MNKSDLIFTVSNKTGLKKNEVKAVVNSVLDTITETLSEGESVSLVGFGTFSVKDRMARTMKNPRTNVITDIPATRAPAFKPGKQLVHSVDPNR